MVLKYEYPITNHHHVEIKRMHHQFRLVLGGDHQIAGLHIAALDAEALQLTKEGGNLGIHLLLGLDPLLLRAVTATLSVSISGSAFCSA